MYEVCENNNLHKAILIPQGKSKTVLQINVISTYNWGEEDNLLLIWDVQNWLGKFQKY